MAAKEAEKKETIRLPRARAGEEDTVFVGVNDESWRIKRGVDVEVPASVAEVLRNAQIAYDYAADYAEGLSSRS